MRTCKLGVFDGAVELLSAGRREIETADSDIRPQQEACHQRQVRSRRRSPHPLPGIDSATSAEVERRVGDVAFVNDTHRFAGLAEALFWVDPLPIERPLPWPQAQRALEVANLRNRCPEKWSLSKLAKHFGVSKPTIAAALRFNQKAMSKPESTDAAAETDSDGSPDQQEHAA